jgi:hypothetical protein
LVAGVVKEVDASVDLAVGDLGEARHVGVPLGRVAAQQVVAAPRGRRQADHRRRSSAARQVHVQHRRLPARGVRLAQGEGSPGVGEEEAVAGAAGQGAHGGVGLAEVGLEGHRLPAEVG